MKLYVECHNEHNDGINHTANTLQPSVSVDAPYSSLCDHITHETLLSFKGQLTKQDMLVFVQVRSQATLRVGKISYLDIPKNKLGLFE